jgi:cytochrome P450
VRATVTRAGSPTRTGSTLGRRDAGSLSFGGGPHFRLGAVLARMEASVAFSLLLDLFPAIAATGEPRRVPGPAFRGLGSFPMRITLACRPRFARGTRPKPP